MPGDPGAWELTVMLLAWLLRSQWAKFFIIILKSILTYIFQMEKFLDIENFLTWKILFFSKKIWTGNNCCSGSWESHKIYSKKKLDSHLLEFSKLIATVLKYNKFCLRRNQSGRKTDKNLKWLRNGHTDIVSDPDSLEVKIKCYLTKPFFNAFKPFCFFPVFNNVRKFSTKSKC